MAAPTLQSIFNQVAEHLLTQNARSLYGGTSTICAYRGGNERKCAVGCLIADKHYHRKLEGDGFGHLPVQRAVRQSIDPHDLMTAADWDKTQDLLRTLQKLHDSLEPEGWPKCLDGIATEFNLKPFTKE